MLPDLLTVLIPTRNRPDYLEACLRSVFQSQNGPIPQVIVSDNSTRDVPEMEVLRNKYPFSYFRQSGKLSMFDHHAVCMSMPTTPWTFLLHDDDELSPNIFGTLESLLIRSSGAGAIIGGIEYIDARGMPCGTWVPEPGGMFKGEDVVLRLGLDNRACPPGIIWNLSAFREAGGFPNSAEAPNDQVLVLKLAYTYGLVFSPDMMGRYRIWENQTTGFSTPQGSKFMMEISFSTARAIGEIGISRGAADQIADYTVWYHFLYVLQLFSKHPLFVFRMFRRCELATPATGPWKSRVRKECPFLFWKPRWFSIIACLTAMTFFPRRVRQPLYSVVRLLNARRNSE